MADLLFGKPAYIHISSGGMMVKGITVICWSMTVLTCYHRLTTAFLNHGDLVASWHTEHADYV